MPLDKPLIVSFNDVNSGPSPNKTLNWDRNKRIARSLCQGKDATDLCEAVITLVNTDPMVLVKAVGPVIEKYRSICASYDEQGADIYNEEVVKPFRANLPERFQAMKRELITEVVVDPEDAPEMSSALQKVVGFSTNGRGQTAQSKADAEKSAREIEDLVNNKIFFTPQLIVTFVGRKADRIQSAVNYWERTPEKQHLIPKLNALMPDGKVYVANVRSNVSATRNPNSRNVDYLLNLALVCHHLTVQIKLPAGETMERYLPRYINGMRPAMCKMIAKGNLSVSMYTGLGEAYIPRGADPRLIGPQALTSKRLTNSLIPVFMPISDDGMEMNPECFSRLAYHNSTFLAICKVVNMCDISSTEYSNNMIAHSRLLRNQMLNKQVYNCPNFLSFDPFKVRIVGRGSRGSSATNYGGSSLIGASSFGGPPRVDLGSALKTRYGDGPNEAEISAALDLVANPPQTDNTENRRMWYGMAHGNGFNGTDVIVSPSVVIPSTNLVNQWYTEKYRVKTFTGPEKMTEIDVFDNDTKRSETVMIPTKKFKQSEFFMDNKVWTKGPKGLWTRTGDAASVQLFREMDAESSYEA